MVNIFNILKNFALISFFYLSSGFAANQDHSLSGGVYHLSAYIASDNFNDLIQNKDHIGLIDSIYFQALDYFEKDISEALLALTFVCLPVRYLPLKIPIFQIELEIPLPGVEEPMLSKKNKNLPSRFLFDSPKSKFGDKDKLSHFFGNAFLAYNIRFINLARWASIYIELFESAFKVEGAVSLRDMQVNKLGELFGIQLSDKADLKPSSFFRLYYLYYMKYF